MGSVTVLQVNVTVNLATMGTSVNFKVRIEMVNKLSKLISSISLLYGPYSTVDV